MNCGWVKLWRKSLEHPLFRKPLIWHFWGYCLLKASHKSGDVFINGEVVKINPGQFVFGRKVASKETGLSEQQIRTCIKHLKNVQNLTIRSTNRFSVISIVNWDSYQDKENKSTSTSTKDQPRANHIQEHKNIKKELFTQFWDLYDKKIDRKKCTTVFMKLKDGDIEKIFKTLPDYIKSTPNKKYRKNPLTYLHGESWNDEDTPNKIVSLSQRAF